MALILTQKEKSLLSNEEFKIKTSGYTYHRVCKLAECQAEIYTNRKDHFYCNTEHHNEYWKRVRLDTSNIKERIRAVEESVKNIEAKLEMS